MSENSVNQASVQSDRKLSFEEILQLRDAIMAEARRKVDPDGTGVDAQMSFSSWGNWDWGERILRYMMAFTTRVEFAVVAGSGAIASGIMYGSAAGERYAGITLAVSGLFAAYVAIAGIAAQFRSR